MVGAPVDPREHEGGHLMLFGAHAFIWAGEWTPEGAEKVIGGAAEAGLDFVEIPLLRPESMDVTATRALLDRYGIGCTCSLGLPKARTCPRHRRRRSRSWKAR